MRAKVFGGIEFAVDLEESELAPGWKFYRFGGPIRQILDSARVKYFTSLRRWLGVCIVSIDWLHWMNRNKTDGQDKEWVFGLDVFRLRRSQTFIVSRADSFYALAERDKGFAPLERGVKNKAQCYKHFTSTRREGLAEARK